MSELDLKIAHAELAFMLIARLHHTAKEDMMSDFSAKVHELRVDPRLNLGLDAETAMAFINHVRSFDPESPDEAVLHVIQEGPNTAMLQEDLCDALIVMGDIHALALQDLGVGANGELVAHFRESIQTEFGASRKRALEAHGGQLWELLLLPDVV